jgi:hypothetical protein
MDSDEPVGDELPTHSEDGVDLTLIRWMLAMTPEQRLEALQQYARSVVAIRELDAGS